MQPSTCNLMTGICQSPDGRSDASPKGTNAPLQAVASAGSDADVLEPVGRRLAKKVEPAPRSPAPLPTPEINSHGPWASGVAVAAIIALPGRAHYVHCISPDSEELLVSGQPRYTYIQPFSKEPPFTTEKYAPAYDDGSKTKLTVFDTRTGALKRALTWDGDYLAHLAWSPQGDRVAVGVRDFQKYAYTRFRCDNATTRDTEDAFEVPPLRFDGAAVAWSSDGRYLAVGDGETISVRDCDSRASLTPMIVSPGSAVKPLFDCRRANFDWCGKSAVLAAAFDRYDADWRMSSYVQTVDVQTHATRFNRAFARRVSSLKASPDGNSLAVTTRDNFYILDSQTGETIRAFANPQVLSLRGWFFHGIALENKDALWFTEPRSLRLCLRIDKPAGCSSLLSSDGRVLGFMDRQQESVVMLRIAPGSQAELNAPSTATRLFSSPAAEKPLPQWFVDDVLQSPIPVLVKFTATWCGPCQLIAPMLHEVAKQRAGQIKLIEVDLDANPEICDAYGVDFVPTLYLFKGGRVHCEIARDEKAKFDLMLDKALE